MPQKQEGLLFQPIPASFLRLKERPVNSRVMTIAPLLSALRFLARHGVSFINLGQSEILTEQEVQEKIGANWHTRTVIGCGYCGSDDHTRNLTWPLSSLDYVGDKIYPYVAGHETMTKIGNKYYFIYPYLNCTTQEQELCGECRNGHENKCERFYRHGDKDRFQGLAHGFGARYVVESNGKVIMIGGGYAREIIVNDNQLFEIDDQIERWVFTDDYACIIHALRVSEKPPNPEEPAVIIGLGPIGLTALDYLVQNNFKKIVVLFKHAVQKNVFEAYQQVMPGVITAINVQDKDYFEKLAESVKATVIQGFAGKFFLDKRFPLIVDCAGTDVSTDLIDRIGNRVAIMTGLPLRGHKDPFRLARADMNLVYTQLATRSDYQEAINYLGNSPFTNWEGIVEKHPLHEMPQVWRGKGPKKSIKLLITPE